MKFILLLSTLLVSISASLDARPNVIVVMTDDQGYGELSCHGNPVLKTPHLDDLHRQSLRFTDYHAAPMCTPTRGQLLTGLDAARNGAINVSSGRTLLRADLPTMADLFAAAGYRTGIFGKWHLGDNYPFRPQDRGFEESLWFPSSHINSVPDNWNNDYFNDTYHHNGDLKSYQGYCTDIFFREAMDWMQQRCDANEPFLVYLPTNAPHSPHWAPEEDRNAIAEAFERNPLPHVGPQLQQRLIPYLAMVRNIDTNVGRLLDFLENNELDDDTILIFTTDNGSTFGHLYYPAGMRGKKTELWEGGHRVPLFVRWPKGGLGEPRDIPGLTQAQDLLPTMLDLCGIPAGERFDGISLASVLRGKAAVPEDRVLVINYSRMPFQFEYPSPDSPSVMRREGAGVLWRQWRLLEDRELYNLENDPLQQENVITDHPEIAARLSRHLDQWWSDVAGNVNQPQRVVIGHDRENPGMLTACEWLDVFVDQQKQVREGVRKNGWWELEVARDGDYEFELRRWPRESGLALDAAAEPEKITAGTLDPGVALPIARARILVGDIYKVLQVKPGAPSASFSLSLKKGPVRLHTWFDDPQRQAICGAYYVYVARK